MKKMVLMAIFMLSIFWVGNAAAESIDILRPDGGATRITVDRDWVGRTTVSTSYVSEDQRAGEAFFALIVRGLLGMLRMSN